MIEHCVTKWVSVLCIYRQKCPKWGVFVKCHYVTNQSNLEVCSWKPSMFTVAHIYSSGGRIVGTYLKDTIRRNNTSVAFPKVAMLPQCMLSVCSLSEGSRATVPSIITNICGVPDTHLKVFWI